MSSRRLRGLTRKCPRKGQARPADGRQLQGLQGPGAAVLSVSFSPDGRRLATLDTGALRIWDVAAGTQRVLARAHAGQTFDVFFAPGPTAFSPDGSRLASPTWDGSAKIWDLPTGKTELILTNPVWVITDVAFSPDGIAWSPPARTGPHACGMRPPATFFPLFPDTPGRSGPSPRAQTEAGSQPVRPKASRVSGTPPPVHR